eukprot:6213652-Amphidinium_carterae.2
MEDAENYYYHMLLPRTLQRTNAIGPLVPTAALPPDLPALVSAQSEFGPMELWSLHMIAPPMGDVKSPDIAQAVHSHVALWSGGMNRGSWMRHGHEAPTQPLWAGTYVDDFGQVALLDPRLPHPLDQASVRCQAKTSHDGLLSGYRTVGIVRKPEKSVVEKTEGTMWGASLSSATRIVQSSVEKRRLVLRATMAVCAARTSTISHLQILLGHWMHQVLFRREVMSVLALTFSWMHVHRASPRSRVTVPRKVKDELIALCLLAPLMRTNLASPLSRWVVATDATLIRGAATVASMSPAVSVALHLRSDRPAQVMHFAPGEIDEDMYVARYAQAPDEMVHDMVASLSFATVASYRFREIQHVNKQEGLAWRSGIFAAIRRGMIQVLKKGRSSSRRLNGVLRSTMPDLLMHGVSIAPVWIGTKHNPADDPTRDQRVRAAVPASCQLCDQLLSPCRP